jgi:hypothetical protein
MHFCQKKFVQKRKFNVSLLSNVIVVDRMDESECGEVVVLAGLERFDDFIQWPAAEAAAAASTTTMTTIFDL